MAVCVLDHPLAKHLLARLRNKDTDPEAFRKDARVLSQMLIVEATRGLPTRPATVSTPLENCPVEQMAQGLVVVPVLRAGLAMLEPALAMFGDVSVGYIGLERSHDTAVAHSYYCKLPSMTNRFSLCLDPMLATGGSASQALSLLKAAGAKQITMVSVVSAPEGIARLEQDHPDVEIVTAAIDRELNAQKYILPGLGDFGDRLFGTA